MRHSFYISLLTFVLFLSSCRHNSLTERDKANLAYSNIEYGDETHQQFDLWQTDDDSDRSAILLLLHQGSFLKGYGDKNTLEMTELAERLGAVPDLKVVCLNYNTISFADGVDYLLPKNKSDFLNADYWTDLGRKLSWENFVRSNLIKAHNDVSTLINFIELNKDSLKVNSDQIFIAGYSAGAILSLSYAFSDTKELNQLYGDFAIHEKHEIFKNKIKGVLSFSGATFDYRIFDKSENNIPILLAHGIEDRIVDIATDYPLKAYADSISKIDIIPKNTFFSFEGIELNWEPEINIHPETKYKLLTYLVPKMNGSEIIHQRTKELNFNTELLKIKGGHNLFFNKEKSKTKQFEKLIKKAQSFLIQNL